MASKPMERKRNGRNRNPMGYTGKCMNEKGLCFLNELSLSVQTEWAPTIFMTC